MHKLGVEEWLVSAVMSMYTGAKTVVRTVYGNSSSFQVKVGMHQGSALSPRADSRRKNENTTQIHVNETNSHP